MANGWGGKRVKHGPKRPAKSRRGKNWGGSRVGSGPKPRPKATEKSWCLYIVHEAESADVCKIGMTSLSSQLRLSALQIGNWRPLVLGAVVAVASEQEMISLEADVHRKLNPQRVAGEWFRISLQAALALIGQTMVEIGIARVTPKQKALFDE